MSSKAAPIPTRMILPKGEEMKCPPTVKQSLMSIVHPLAGPALVSPDIAAAKERQVETSPAVSRTPFHDAQQQRSKVAAPPLALTGGLISSDIQILAPRSMLKPKPSKSGPLPTLPKIGRAPIIGHGGVRLNKFVRRLHDMLIDEKDSGIVEWRRGLLVLHSTDAFAKTILPKYFNTRNFKTFRRQLNYYGFVHVRSFSTTGSTTTALWVNRDLANRGTAEISSVLMLKRVEPCEAAKTVEGRRVRKEMAIFTVEEDIGVSPKSIQLEQIQSLASRVGIVESVLTDISRLPRPVKQAKNGVPPVPKEVHCHHSVPSSAFPSLSSSRGVSCPSSNRMEPSPTDHMSSASNSYCTTQDQSNYPEDNIGAANLLLMLSGGGGRSASISDSSNDSPPAMTPEGYPLM